MGILADKVAIVTGGGQGVGRGIALALAQEGAAIMLIGRTPSTLRQVAREIAQRGGTADIFQADVKLAADIKAAVQHTHQRFTAIDILINNAQEVPLGRLLDVDDESFLDGFASGPLATFRFMKACHPHFITRGGGAVVNLATAAAQRWDMAGYGCYAAVKQATRALTRAGASEWGRDNIRVNTIAPTFIETPMTKPYLADATFRASVLAKIKLGRLGQVEDLMGAVVYLASDASRLMTGTSMVIDGGWTAG